MNLLELFISRLAEDLPQAAGAPELGVRIVPDEVEMKLPIEARFGAGGMLEATTPRTRLRTGFDLPIAQLALRFVVEEGGVP